jgi:hypothetical protein
VPRVAVPAALAILFSVFLSGFAASAPTPALASAGLRQCTKWDSKTQPPPTIAVYRVSEGFVERVDFKHYVTRVVSSEWNVPQAELRKAGAVAAKQYAWYHVLHWRGGKHGGKCYDVKDTTADQKYMSKSLQMIPNGVHNAVEATWSWRLWRGEKFPMTGYRTGTVKPCASDAGYRLYAKSAKRCAEKGWSAGRILRVYYTADLKTD